MENDTLQVPISVELAELIKKVGQESSLHHRVEQALNLWLAINAYDYPPRKLTKFFRGADPEAVRSILALITIVNNDRLAALDTESV